MRYPLCPENRLNGHGGQEANGDACNTLILFVVGGVTYEEAKEVSMFGK